jgi:hypothetical protein
MKEQNVDEIVHITQHKDYSEVEGESRSLLKRSCHVEGDESRVLKISYSGYNYREAAE